MNLPGELRVINGEPCPSRGGLSPALATLTAGTCLAVTSLLMSFDHGFHSDQLSQNQDDRQQKQPESMGSQTVIHSGPFRIENLSEEICFMHDGFTIAIGEKTFRMQSVKTCASYTPGCVKSIIGPITKIECENELVIRAGDQCLHINRSDFLRILHLLSADHPADDVCIDNLPYKLELSGFCSMIIPSSGTCDITFFKMREANATMAQAGGQAQ